MKKRSIGSCVSAIIFSFIFAYIGILFAFQKFGGNAYTSIVNALGFLILLGSDFMLFYFSNELSKIRFENEREKLKDENNRKNSDGVVEIDELPEL